MKPKWINMVYFFWKSCPTKHHIFSDHPHDPSARCGCPGSSRDAVVCSDAPWPGSLTTFERPRNYDGRGRGGTPKVAGGCVCENRH